MAIKYRRRNSKNVPPVKGVFGILIVTIFLLIFLAGACAFLYKILSNQDTKVTLDQEQLNEYCESQYSNEFINSKSYEDNVLFVFLYDKEYSSYEFSVYTGKHFILDAKNYLQGHEIRTTISRYLRYATNEEDIEYYLYLSFEEIANDIEGKFSSYHNCNDNNEYIYRLKNKTEYEFDNTKIEKSLKAFTDTTGLSVVLLVDTLDDVSEKNKVFNQDVFILIIIMSIVLVIITAAYIFVIKNTIHNKKNPGKTQKNKSKAKKKE